MTTETISLTAFRTFLRHQDRVLATDISENRETSFTEQAQEQIFLTHPNSSVINWEMVVLGILHHQSLDYCSDSHTSYDIDENELDCLNSCKYLNASKLAKQTPKLTFTIQKLEKQIATVASLKIGTSP